MGHKGQSIVEYVLLMGIATMALLYMGTDFKRGIQSVFKVTVDQLGEQTKSEQDFSAQSGAMINSVTAMKQSHQKTVEALGNNGTRYIINDSEEMLTNSLTNVEHVLAPESS
jgi:hypothetical protein